MAGLARFLRFPTGLWMLTLSSAFRTEVPLQPSLSVVGGWGSTAVPEQSMEKVRKAISAAQERGDGAEEVIKEAYKAADSVGMGRKHASAFTAATVAAAQGKTPREVTAAAIAAAAEQGATLLEAPEMTSLGAAAVADSVAETTSKVDGVTLDQISAAAAEAAKAANGNADDVAAAIAAATKKYAATHPTSASVAATATTSAAPATTVTVAPSNETVAPSNASHPAPSTETEAPATTVTEAPPAKVAPTEASTTPPPTKAKSGAFQQQLAGLFTFVLTMSVAM